MPDAISATSVGLLPALTVGREVPALRPANAAPLAAVERPNPSLVLAPALGIVVIQFHDQAGAVTISIPTQRQLEAYEANPFAAPKADDDTALA